MDHGQFILGPEVRELEQKLAEYTGSKHCVSVSSGTDSLLIALMALGVGAGDEVITVPYRGFPLPRSLLYLVLNQCLWIFVPILGIWMRLNLNLPLRIKPKQSCPYPYMVNARIWMPSIRSLKSTVCPLSKMRMQSFGATYKGEKSCNLSTIGSTSFFPSKPLGCYGDGGALFTNDDELAEKFRWIRVHGQERKHHHPILGLNGRMDTLQAAILLEILEVFPDEVQKRQNLGQTYSEGLAKIKGLETPRIGDHNTSVYAQYTVLSEQIKKSNNP